MADSVRVSVIMPAYNYAQFIGAAIESVLGQSWQDWELIIVDDGSTDATPAVIAGFHDPRIRALRRQNGGEAAARNSGLDLARGEYISFLDADDLYLPNALADRVAFLETHPEYGVVVCDGYFL